MNVKKVKLIQKLIIVKKLEQVFYRIELLAYLSTIQGNGQSLLSRSPYSGYFQPNTTVSLACHFSIAGIVRNRCPFLN